MSLPYRQRKPSVRRVEKKKEAPLSGFTDSGLKLAGAESM